MSRFDQGSVRSAPEKVAALETCRTAVLSGGEIRGQRCGASTGMSLHGPMT